MQGTDLGPDSGGAHTKRVARAGAPGLVPGSRGGRDVRPAPLAGAATTTAADGGPALAASGAGPS